MCRAYSKKIINQLKKVSIVLFSMLLIIQCILMRYDTNMTGMLLTNGGNVSQHSQMGMLIDQAEPVESENLLSLSENQTKLIQTSFKNQFQADPFGFVFASSGQHKALQYATVIGSACGTIMISMKYIVVRLQKDGKK